MVFCCGTLVAELRYRLIDVVSAPERTLLQTDPIYPLQDLPDGQIGYYSTIQGGISTRLQVYIVFRPDLDGGFTMVRASTGRSV